VYRLCPSLRASQLCYSLIRGLRHGKKLDMAHPFQRLALPCLLGCLMTFGGQAQAAQIYAGDGLDVRWDTTLRYSIALRPQSRSGELLSYINGDDGDRNFAPGPVSDRLDLVTKLDIAAGDVGLHASAAVWYDAAYRGHTDNSSPATDNTASPARQFAPAVRDLQGQHAELLDAFAYGNFALGQTTVSVRAGRQTLLGGESRFFDTLSIAAAMAPTDYLRTMTDQNGYAGNMFLPVTQASVTLQPLPWFSLTLYNQFEWRASRQPGDGSYLSYVDYVGTGAVRLFLTPNQYLARLPESGPASGQKGVMLHANVADMDLGIYALRFRAKDPVAVLLPDPALAGQAGAIGNYRLVYPPGLNLFGASFSKDLGDAILAGELSARESMPLVNYDARAPQYAAPTRFPFYARGDTLHAQISVAAALAESPLWDKADLTTEIASDHILNLSGVAPGGASYSRFALKGRARIEPHYFRVLPNLDVTGMAELGVNLTGRSFTYYAQNSGTGDFRVGLSATYRSAWKAGISYAGFLGPPSRQPLADRDFLLLSLERTF